MFQQNWYINHSGGQKVKDKGTWIMQQKETMNSFYKISYMV